MPPTAAHSRARNLTVTELLTVLEHCGSDPGVFFANTFGQERVSLVRELGRLSHPPLSSEWKPLEARIEKLTRAEDQLPLVIEVPAHLSDIDLLRQRNPKQAFRKALAAAEYLLEEAESSTETAHAAKHHLAYCLAILAVSITHTEDAQDAPRIFIAARNLLTDLPSFALMDLLVRGANYLTDVGYPQPAVALLHRAFVLATLTDQPQLTRRITRHLGYVHYFTAEYDLSILYQHRHLKLITPGPEGKQHVISYQAIAQASMEKGDLEVAVHYLRKATALLTHLSPSHRASLLWSLAKLQVRRGEYQDGRTLLLKAIDTALDAFTGLDLLDLFCTAAEVLHQLDDRRSYALIARAVVPRIQGLPSNRAAKRNALRLLALDFPSPSNLASLRAAIHDDRYRSEGANKVRLPSQS